MTNWSRFLDRIIALVNSPGFDKLTPAEQDQLYDEIAWLTRAERLLARSLSPQPRPAWPRTARCGVLALLRGLKRRLSIRR